MRFKEEVYKAFRDLLSARISALRQTLRDLDESAKNETKSTAGDKHETALAMLQIEQENVRRQLRETGAQQLIFEKINPVLQTGTIRLGALVQTDKNYFFVSAGIGKISISGKLVIALSATSPLGAKLIGLRPGGIAATNTTTYRVISIE